MKIQEQVTSLIASRLHHWPASKEENWLLQVALTNTMIILVMGGSTPELRCERAVAEVCNLCDMHIAGIRVEMMTQPVKVG